jgi:hypothetical protein
VRISTPPVREASTNPSAGIVDGGVGGGLLLRLLGGVPVERLLVDFLVALDLDLGRGQLLHRAGAVARASVARGLHLGGERDQRSRQSVDLVGREGGAVDEVGLLLGQQPLEAEDQRIVAAPLHRGLAAARVDLRQRGVERGAPRRAARQRDGGVLAVEHQGLLCEALGALQVVAGDRRR